MAMDFKECGHCFAPNARPCVCGQEAYCNSSCQRAEWPTHKMVCPMVSVQNRTMIVNRNISTNQILATVSPILVLDLSDPAGVCDLWLQFSNLSSSQKQEVSLYFGDEDVYKTMEDPMLRDNKQFLAFYLTISLEDFETLMRIYKVINNKGIVFENLCLFFPNLTTAAPGQIPNITIEVRDKGELNFLLRTVQYLPRGSAVTAAKMVKDVRYEMKSVLQTELAFKALDRDGDGYLSMNDFGLALNLICRFGSEEVKIWFTNADYDCDGKIGLDDFCRFVTEYK